MLKVGTQNISALYVGQEKIKKAYLGETLVFGADPNPEPGPSRLPEGYTEVEYVQSDGYCYIDTGYAPYTARSSQLTMDIEPLSATGTGYFFASIKASGSSTYRYMCCYTSSAIKAAMGTDSVKTIINNPSLKRMEILYDFSSAMTVSVDDATITFSNWAMITTMSNVRLLGNTSSNYLTAKLYSCQIKVKGEPFRDFVPCINPSGAVGLYDLVEGKFYGNSGTGTLTAGPAI